MSRPNSVNFSEYSFLASDAKKTFIYRLLSACLVLAVLGAVIYLVTTLLRSQQPPPTVLGPFGKIIGQF